MRILVTGASGVIGRRLATAFAMAGHEVTALVRLGSQSVGLFHRNIRTQTGDITVRDSLRPLFHQIDCVVHAAGVKSASRQQTLTRVNVTGTHNMADLAHEAGVGRFFYISSIAAQGPSRPGNPHRAPGGENPVDEYGHSKLAAERLLTQHEISDRLTILRPAVLYGPSEESLIPWIKCVNWGIVPVVTDMELSFLHINDLAHFMTDLLDDSIGGIGPYFLSEGRPVGMDRVIDAIEQNLNGAIALRLFASHRVLSIAASPMRKLSSALGISPRMTKLMTDLSSRSWGCECLAAQHELNFNPQTTLEDGLANLVEWCRSTRIIR